MKLSTLIARIAYVALYVPLWLFGMVSLGLHFLSEFMGWFFLILLDALEDWSGW